VTSRPAATTAARLLVDGHHERVENRVAYRIMAFRIIAFRGSMRFVYLHVVWSACRIGFRVERTDAAPAPVSPGGGPTP
jgi:hypothetical protein